MDPGSHNLHRSLYDVPYEPRNEKIDLFCICENEGADQLLGYYSLYLISRNFKPLSAQFGSDLVGNSEDR